MGLGCRWAKQGDGVVLLWWTNGVSAFFVGAACTAFDHLM